MQLTYKLKLLANSEDLELLRSTMSYYNQICNYVSETCFESKVFRNFDIHKLCYHNARTRFPLASSQFVVRTIKSVTDSYADKTKRTSQHVFKSKSAVTYDSRILTFKLDKDGFPYVSIWTIQGKRRKIYLHLNKYQLSLMPKFKKETDLVLNKKTFYLNSPVEYKEPQIQKSIDFIGVDLGVVNIACTSDRIIYSNEKIEKRRKKNLRTSFKTTK